MGDRLRLHRFLAVSAAAACALGLALEAQPAATPPANAKIWIGRAAEIENFLRTTPIVKMDDLSVGVTHPKKATLPPGGPVPYFAWKPIPPARYSGFWESYLSEIAAYELDKLLQLNMVPPTVEREYKGDKGAAVMWASPTKSFKELGGKGAPDAPPIYAAAWARQISQAKMFDNLINNLDPNLGNWLVDPSWHLILIDHTRAFTGGTRMIHEMTHIDPDLWARMRALDEPAIHAAIGKWLIRGGEKTIIQRRDKMQQIIDALVKAHGADNVFIRSHE